MHHPVPCRFHSHHGSNIAFENNFRTAIRHSSFANALTFSERPLSPGEIFLVEIDGVETGWSGHMRIGLTQINPNSNFELPLYALPDLVSMGPCWLYAITKSHSNYYDLERQRQQQQDESAGGGEGDEEDEDEELVLSYQDELRSLRGRLNELRGVAGVDDESVPGLNIDESVFEGDPLPFPMDGEEDDEFNLENDNGEGGSGDNQVPPEESQDSQESRDNDENRSLLFNQPSYRNRVLVRNGEQTWTPYGYIPHRKLLPNVTGEGGAANLLPTDVGSRIGVMYIPTSSNQANMHFIINGEDQGPCFKGIPYKNKDIFAVVDVYGSTKGVSIVPLYGVGVSSLQEICREVILNSIQQNGVSGLPLPGKLKNFLLFNENS